MLSTKTLRPGLLVSLKTSISGNVSYRALTLESEHIADDGTARARWETLKITDDPEEFKAATIARSKARSLVTAVCAPSAFGLLCPEADRDALDRAVEEAREVARQFNDTSSQTRVSVNVIAGRIAPDDVEAVRAINSEVRDLLAEMERGLGNLDVKIVREAAGKAKAIGSMLNPEAASRIQVAIDAARSAARQIVKAGEGAAVEIDKRAIRACTEARTLFLDMDDAAELQTPEAAARGGIDLEPESGVVNFGGRTVAAAEMEFS